MFSKIALCSDAESFSVAGFEFHLMRERTRFSLSHCLQHSVAVIHMTHGNPVFCSSNNTCKKKGKKKAYLYLMFTTGGMETQMKSLCVYQTVALLSSYK